MKKFLLLVSYLFILGSSINTFAQQKYTLSGYIKDANNGETLLGAYVYDANDKTSGTSTNLYGFYSLSLAEGTYTIEASFVGFQPIQKQITLNADQTLNFELSEEGIVMDAVVISARAKDENIESTDMGKVDLSVESIKKLPALMGEVDVVRTIQLLPGVMSAGEVSSGLYVRGGGADQNLILLDEAVVYNIGHLFGFFSVFNSDAIKNNTLYKGSMPAMYGGRLSSVLDVTMKEGNNKRFQVDGGIGLISSRLTVQGPIQKDKSSFLISGRRTYIDILTRPFIRGTDFEGNGYYFYDLNAKANYILSDKDRVFISGYFGRDVFNFRGTDGFSFDMPWGNATATARWNHVFSNKLFMNATAIYNSYDFGVNASFDNFSSRFFSGVEDYNAKLDFDYFANSKHTLKFGANYTYHIFTPYSVEATVGDVAIETDDLNKQRAHEAAIYIQDEFKIGDRIKVNAGIRGSFFQQVGPYITPILGENGVVTDSLRYGKNEPIANYGGIEPRLSVRYSLNDRVSFKGAVTVANQYIHLVSNSTSTLPTDLWVPSTALVRPQRGIQYSLGYFQNFADNQFESSVEVYYKDLRNQIEFAEDYVPELNEPVENSFVFGTGRSYGAEFFLKKRTGDFTGWIGYTLSRTDRTFPDINNGRTFPARFDRRHDLSIVLNYQVNRKLNVSAVFVYGTGQALTLPNSFFVYEGWLYTEFDMPRNSYRLQPYHRLDLSATLNLNKKEDAKMKNDLVFSIYNAYSRQNPFFVYASAEIPNVGDAGGGNADVTTQNVDINLNQVSLFPIIPSVSWNFSF